jgi:hypothetical protein
MTAEPIVPGMHLGLDEQVYHRDPDSLSVSGAKTLLRCPALFKWQQDHPVRKDVFDFGTAAHALVLGVGSELAIHEYDPEKVKGPKSTNAWKAEQEEVRARGGVLLLPEEHDAITAMADALSSHSLAMRLLSQGEPEVSAFCPDDETGVTRRARFDWLGPRWITDYKTAASVDPRDLAGRYGAVSKWKYDMQAAWYTDVARDLGRTVDTFAFIFQAKEPPYLVTVAVIPDDDLDDARERNRQALALFRDCTESGQWPGYLPDDTAAVLSLTDQFYDQETA